MLKITAAKQNIVKKIMKKKEEDSLRDLWDNIKSISILIIGVLKGEGRRQ